MTTDRLRYSLIPTPAVGQRNERFEFDTYQLSASSQFARGCSLPVQQSENATLKEIILHHISPSLDIKILTVLVGRVEAICDETAVVSLLEEKTKERLEAHCDSDLLTKNGLGEGDEFKCQVIRRSGKTSVEFERLLPRHVPETVMREIRNRVSEVWG